MVDLARVKQCIKEAGAAPPEPLQFYYFSAKPFRISLGYKEYPEASSITANLKLLDFTNINLALSQNNIAL
jgi:hypothetical protein